MGRAVQAGGQQMNRHRALRQRVGQEGWEGIQAGP